LKSGKGAAGGAGGSGVASVANAGRGKPITAYFPPDEPFIPLTTFCGFFYLRKNKMF
jgi:hypothetical protein